MVVVHTYLYVNPLLFLQCVRMYVRTCMFPVVCLTGSKMGCGEGGCGACTVMLSKCTADDEEVKHFAVNACLTPLCAVHGMAVTTVEGIGSTSTALHPCQVRLNKDESKRTKFRGHSYTTL